jgi:hypothetical protein
MVSTSGVNMANFLNFSLFNQVYDRFLSLFPSPLHWLVSLIVLVALVVAFFNLVRFHWIFIIILILLLPFLFPILQSLFAGLYGLFYHLLAIVWAGAPKPTP